VRALTGTDPDRLKEEQERGITIDLGFAHLENGGVSLAFVDVPGHERFVRNMLAGAGGIDIVMLVVAADESVMPQTREHFQICRLLQVPAGILVLTKADAADDEMLELAGAELRDLAAGSFLADAPMLAVSSKTGAGLDALRDALTSLACGTAERRRDGPVRLPIDRVFSVKGFGTVVTGTLVAGEVRQDEELSLLPSVLPVKARGLQVQGRRVENAAAGCRVALNLGGVDLGDVQRGDTVCTPDSLQPTRRVDAVVDVLGDAPALRHGARVRFHQGTTEVLGRVAVGAPRSGSGSTVAEVVPGGSGYMRIRFEGTAVLTRGDRFILRAYSPPVTVGGGIVLDPHPPRSAIRNVAAVDRFRRLDVEGDARERAAVLTFVEEQGAAGFPLSKLGSRAGLAPATADALVEALVREGRVVQVGNVLAAPAVLRTLGDRLAHAIAVHHDQQPLSEGLPREEARVRIFGRAPGAMFEHVVSALVASGTIAARDRLALAGRHLQLSAEEAHALEAIERLFRDARFTPPDVGAVAGALGLQAAVVDRMTKLLLRQKALVKLDAVYFHAEALSALKGDVRALKQAGGEQVRVDVAAFKARYGITRKHAIPLLEYLDRERVTRRVADARVVL
jgi:selenocysteine-specific elongation factor